MKLKCDGLALSEAVLKVSKAMPIKRNNSILEGIKLQAKDGFLTLTATDLELSIIKKIPAEVSIEGEVLVIGRYFADFVKSLTDDVITLESTGGQNITIKYGDNEGFIKCMEVDEYPSVDRIDEKSAVVLAKEDLKDAINKVAFAASQEDSRPILKGVLFEIQNGLLTAVALDGYRLALCKKRVINEVEDSKVIIPARTLTEVLRVIDEGEDEVRLIFGEGKLMVEINNTQLISRLIGGDYINYRNIISTGFATTAVFSRAQFADSIGRASIISRTDKNNTIRLEVKEGLIMIDSRSEYGNVHESIVAEVEGKDVVISFNCKYLQDVLGAVTDEFIKMNIKTGNSPCIFDQVDGEDYLFLVLPMRAGN